VLRVYVAVKKKTSTGFSSTTTKLGFAEIELDELPESGGEGEQKWFNLTPVPPSGGGGAAESPGKGGRLRLALGFSRKVEAPATTTDANGAVFVSHIPDTEDDDHLEETEEAMAAAFDQMVNGGPDFDADGKPNKKKKKKKKKRSGANATLTRKEAVECVYGMLGGRVKADDVDKRYIKFGGGKKGLKAMGREDFVEFYSSIRPVAPNELQVVVIRAENLRAADGTTFGGAGSSDPYVELVVGKQKQKTKVVKKDLNPVFVEKFSFKAADAQIPLQVLIHDHDDFGTNDFLGRTTVTLKSLLGADPIPRCRY
jgi:hypothetical protein